MRRVAVVRQFSDNHRRLRGVYAHVSFRFTPLL
jgi:hypothetical protein